MATNKHATVRYNILDKCFSNYNHKYTFEDLLEVCREAIHMEYGDESGISTRTLRDDIRFMKSEEGFSAPIVSRKDGGKPYYIYEDKEFSINKQKLSAAEMEQLKNTLITLSRFKGLPQFDWINEAVARLEGEFKLKSNISDAVGFEHNPYLRGLEHFDALFQAISNKKALKISYHPSFAEAQGYIVHPYFLKQYNNRWFLFGLSEELIINMALDRIDSVVEADCCYVENDNVDFDDYFDDVVGVSVPYDKELESVILKIERDRYKYIETKPIHHSQRIIHDMCDDDNIAIGLKLIPNYEFETLLLGFADSIEIIKPLKLKEKIKGRAQIIFEKNR